MGPPNEVGPRDTTPEGTDTTSTPAPVRTSCRFHSNGTRRPVGRYTAGWKDGFTAGAVDALRRAGRWLPGDPDTWPEIWAALDVLADAYQLAGGDVADGLIAEQRVSRRLVGGDD